MSTPRAFRRILIANRGEIACRIIATCRRLGIETVAVYSEADAGARHVRLADQALCIGGAAPANSYLDARRVLDAARRSGAEAIHPGYGFLSENADFAAACAEAGRVFIGPPVAAIRAMGSKAAAKQLMAAAGVPLVPGDHDDDQDPARLAAAAEAIGWPVLIKASAGGGGRGMRIVERAADFPAALAACQREARAAFGDDRVLIEKYLQRPRHIEVQVFGDAQGRILSLHERDCSAQRRHQTVIEEAPAPGMSAEQRARMGRAACDAARAVGYVGAGTVEFIVDGESGAFYFMEMNTRLQVEHPVTEMVTGLDLVEWQLRVAAGESLPLDDGAIPLDGHAIEVRIYAEEPAKGFLPATGRLRHFVPPPTAPWLRVDSGVEQGDEVSPHYDPMLAKLIVHGRDRDQACERMLRALDGFELVGVGNNIAFLRALVASAPFRAGEVDTGLIERQPELWQPAGEPPPAAVLALAAAGWLRAERDAQAHDAGSPWALADGWRMGGESHRRLAFEVNGEPLHVDIVQGAGGELRLDGAPCRVQADGTQLTLDWRQQRLSGSVVIDGGLLHVFAGGHWRLRYLDPLAVEAEAEAGTGDLSAPMPGRIVKLLVEAGSTVTRGTPLLVMEAMKMEHSLQAPADGRVIGYRCAEGEQVHEGAELVDFEASE